MENYKQIVGKELPLTNEVRNFELQIKILHLIKSPSCHSVVSNEVTVRNKSIYCTLDW